MKFPLRRFASVLSFALILPLTQCAVTQKSAGISSRAPRGPTQRGLASFYSVRTNGRTTASGIPLSDSKLTAAHRTLPFGTWVRVTNIKNGRSQVVRITDRGPFKRGRIIDVSARTARDLDMVDAGVVPVEIEVLRPPNRA